MFCPYCGSQLNDGSEFCSTCGRKLNAPKPGEIREVTAAQGGMPVATGGGSEMPSVGGSTGHAPVCVPVPNEELSGCRTNISVPHPVNDIPQPTGSTQSAPELMGITPPPFPGNNTTDGNVNAPFGVPGGFPSNSANGIPGDPSANDRGGFMANAPGGSYGNAPGGFTPIPPSFGQPQPEIAAVKPLKKKKTPLIIVLVALGVILLGGAAAFIITLNNGFLYRSGGVKTIYDITHLCVQHHYIDADCENPERCEICGNEQGEPLGHEWAEATCTAPQTCSVCGKTEGDPLPHSWQEATCTSARECTVCGAKDGSPLGHTTRLGKCGRCGEKVTELESTFYQILGLCNDGDSYYSIGYELIANASASSSSAYYVACVNATNYFVLASSKYREAAIKCGDYSEFADLKKYINNMVKYLPTTEPNYSTNSLSNFIDDLIDFTYATQDYARCALDILDLL